MLVTLFAGIFGLVVGSFLNVIILRYGERGIGGRSACMACHRQLAWYELVPLLSYVVLLGRCRTCRVRISPQYPFVEALTGALFALLAGGIGELMSAQQVCILLLSFAVAALLVAIAVYDLRHTIIPDPWVYTFAVLALLMQLPFVRSFDDLLLALVAGPLAAVPLFALWAISKGAWMGFGDVKLAIGIGFLLGPFLGLFAILFGFILGGIVAAPLLVLSTRWWKRAVLAVTPMYGGELPALGFTMKSEVPFGPFLIASTLLLWILTLYGLPLPIIG